MMAQNDKKSLIISTQKRSPIIYRILVVVLLILTIGTVILMIMELYKCGEKHFSL